jgi:hypothetical protein
MIKNRHWIKEFNSEENIKQFKIQPKVNNDRISFEEKIKREPGEFALFLIINEDEHVLLAKKVSFKNIENLIEKILSININAKYEVFKEHN